MSDDNNSKQKNTNTNDNNGMWIDINNNQPPPPPSQLHDSNYYQHKFDTLPRSFTEMAKSFRESNTEHNHGNSIIRKINWNHYIIMAILFGILILSMVYLVHHDSRKCTVDQKMVDNCLRRLMFFSNDQDQHFPTTHKQLDIYCKEKEKSIKCLRNFVEGGCLDVDYRQQRYFKKFVLNYKHQLDKTCLRQVERQKFIDYAECFSRNDLLKSVRDCNENVYYQLGYIAQNLQGQQRLQTGCCVYNQRNHCFDQKISNGCSSEIRDFVLERIESPFRTIMESLCPQQYKTIDGCKNSLKSSLWQKVFENPKLLKLQNERHQRHRTNNNHSKNNNNDTMALEHDLNNDTSSSPDHQIDNLRFKMIQLKFYENFLSFFLVFRTD